MGFERVHEDEERGGDFAVLIVKCFGKFYIRRFVQDLFRQCSLHRDPPTQDITVVLLPVSLPQLKDPINGIFREGLTLAYDRSLRPSHADELRELVQDPTKKTEIIFFLDAYDGGLGLEHSEHQK